MRDGAQQFGAAAWFDHRLSVSFFLCRRHDLAIERALLQALPWRFIDHLFCLDGLHFRIAEREEALHVLDSWQCRLDVEVVFLIELAAGDVLQRRLAAVQLRVADADRRWRGGGLKKINRRKVSKGRNNIPITNLLGSFAGAMSCGPFFIWCVAEISYRDKALV